MSIFDAEKYGNFTKLPQYSKQTSTYYISAMGKAMNFGEAEVVKCNTQTWFGHLERMGKRKKMTRIVYE